jgi:hypothetical protein
MFKQIIDWPATRQHLGEAGIAVQSSTRVSQRDFTATAVLFRLFRVR